MTREIVRFESLPVGYRVFGSHTPLGYSLWISTAEAYGGVAVINLLPYGDQSRALFVIVRDRNVYELIKSRAPLWIVIDALLEVNDDEWIPHKHNAKLAQQCIEQLALMELVPMEQP